MEPGLSSAPERELRGRDCPADWSTHEYRPTGRHDLPPRRVAVRSDVRNISPHLPLRAPGAAENGRVLILLPPSETKTRPDEDAATVLDLEGLELPQLAEPRATMLRAARRTAAGTDGAARLGVPASAPELVDRMARIDSEPTAGALAVYSGVLYDQLRADHAPAPDRRVLVQSALFGLVDAAGDRIPAYRLSAGSTLSRLGKAGSWWSPRLKPVAAQLRREQAEGGSPVVLDCRSGSYRSMMAMRSGEGVRVLEVSPVQERGGVRTVISHEAKRYRGLVTRALLEAERTPTSADEVVDVVRTAFGTGLRVELDADRLVVVDRVS